MTSRHPLSWPQHVPRRDAGQRRTSGFGTKTAGIGKRMRPLTIAEAIDRLQGEIDRLGASNVILSTNLELRLDGTPRSNQAEPKDPGAALWFTRRGKSICLPCDSFTKVADNIAGIAAHIRALRDIERYGVASVQQMFTGFEALPAPAQAKKRPWRAVLELDRMVTKITEEDVRTAYRRLAQFRHPDNPKGSHEAMAELNNARDEALKELR